MKFKGLIFIITYLILLSSIAAAQNFVVEDIHATVDGKRDLLDYKEDITIKHGSTLQVEVRFENRYSLGSGIDVEVELEGTINDIDAGHDIDEVEDAKIKPGNSEKLILVFQIPYITEDDDYWLELEVIGEADNGDKYEYFLGHKLELNKPQNELTINNLKLNKDIIGCDSTILVSFDIPNTGSSDEEDLRYVIENKGIGIFLQRKDLMISEGETIPIVERINVESVPIGEHRIYVSAYCNDDETSVVRYVPIKKEACGTQSSGQTSTQQTQTTQPSSSITQQTTQQTSIQQPQQIPSTQSGSSRVIKEGSIFGSSLLVLLISVGAIAIYGIIYLVARLVKK